MSPLSSGLFIKEKKKQTLCPFFMNSFHLLQSLFLTVKSTRLPSTRLIDLGRLKDWAYYGAIYCIWNLEPWISDQESLPQNYSSRKKSYFFNLEHSVVLLKEICGVVSYYLYKNFFLVLFQQWYLLWWKNKKCNKRALHIDKIITLSLSYLNIRQNFFWGGGGWFEAPFCILKLATNGICFWQKVKHYTYVKVILFILYVSKKGDSLHAENVEAKQKSL